MHISNTSGGVGELRPDLSLAGLLCPYPSLVSLLCLDPSLVGLLRPDPSLAGLLRPDLSLTARATVLASSAPILHLTAAQQRQQQGNNTRLRPQTHMLVCAHQVFHVVALRVTHPASSR
jgi:hypothetical protein